jgi:monothiol glutaredoxin
MALSDQTRAKITRLLSDHEIVLFMKGTRSQPRCGFSATVVQILDGYGVSYQDVDVLADPALRDGIKEFGNWPTIPQLYYKGSLLGGCDIVRELDQSGELLPSLGLPNIEVKAPSVRLSESAAAQIREAAAQAEPGQGVRIVVQDRGRNHEMIFDHEQPGDFVVEAHGVRLLFDRGSARLADGLSIDFVEGPGGGGFRLDNPNAPARVRPLSPRELREKLDRGEPLRLYDVRTPEERRIALIPGAVLLDERAEAELLSLPKETMLVFHCHHGRRSLAAAEHFLQKGFTNVWNLQGGIDAWSTMVDPQVKRY